MIDDFDIGPLTWVKDEIDQALNSVQDQIHTLRANNEDLVPLKFCQTHLYQVSGALDMVGLEGCKRFCAELEKLASKFERKVIPVSDEGLTLLSSAVTALGSYLQDLLNGLPDVPLRLFPQFSELGAFQGEALEEAELFFPDTTIRAPKDIESVDVSESELENYFLEQRNSFQKILLNWLKSGEVQNLKDMRNVIQKVLYVQKTPSGRTLWWVTSGFFDAITDPLLSSNNGIKKLCRRIDQQLKSMAEGNARSAGNLLRDTLYFIAISSDTSDLVLTIKNTFDLHKYLPSRNDDASTTSNISEREIACVSQCLAIIDVLKENWSNFSDGDLNGIKHFISEIGKIALEIDALSNHSVKNLFLTVLDISKIVEQDITKITESAFIEVAAGLNLLEEALGKYQHIDIEVHENLNSQTHRVLSSLTRETTTDKESNIGTKLDSSVILAVAKQIRATLQQVEQYLDTFFRKPSDKSPLFELDKPIAQVVAAFQMLEMDLPTNVVITSEKLISQFKAENFDLRADLFEMVAESLSIVGFYVDELPRIRFESTTALEEAYQRLLTHMRDDSQVDNQGVELAEYGMPDAEIKHPDFENEITDHESVSNIRNENNNLVDFDETPAVQNEVSMSDQFISVTPLQSNKKPKLAVSIEVGAIHFPVTENIDSHNYLYQKDSATDAELLDIYLAESEEVLGNIAQNLQAFRLNNTNYEALVEIRRGFHTLKGSGRTVGLLALGEVAAGVEKLLNFVLDNKYSVTDSLLDYVETVSASFSNWADELSKNGETHLSVEEWKEKASSLESELLLLKPPALPEDVLIGGTHKISRVLFNVFMTEARQHMATLLEFSDLLSPQFAAKPTDESRRAAHTLASNAGTAGLKAMCDLSRALEHWLDAHNGHWDVESCSLYKKTVETLEKMLNKAQNLEQPKQSIALLKKLKDAIVSASTEQESIDESSEPVEELVPDFEILSDSESANLESPQVSEHDGIEVLVTPDQVEAVKSDSQDRPLILDSQTSVAQPQQTQTSTKSTSVDEELLTMFIEEAKELVPQVGKSLRAWRAEPLESDYPDELQRALHTLKGSARMANQSALGDTIHTFEDRVIRVLKSKNPTVIDFEDMFAYLDQIGLLLEDSIGTTDIDQPANLGPTRANSRRAQYLRLRADVLDRLINEAGEISIARSRMDREMQGFKQFSLDLTESVMRLRNYLRELEIEAESQLQSRMTHLQETNETFDPLEFDRFTRLQELTRMMAESVNDVSTIQHGLLNNLDETEAALQQQNRMNRELQHGLMNVRMVPFSLMSERLQRIVRQTSRELDKPAEMIIDGEEVEIDRSVLDKVGAPLEHLLRNAVAHGLESKELRKKSGKAEQGKVTLRVRQESDEIVLTVTDDGNGIDLSRVRDKAIQNGLFKVDQKLSEQELLSIIFEPGFSTASEVTQISGRGVGLDSVRSDITALGGRIDVSNVSGQGAVFSIYLPVTLSVAQVVIVRAGINVFAIPSVMVEQVQKLKPVMLDAAYENQNIEWVGKKYPIYFLGRLVGDIVHQAEQQAYAPVIMLRSGNYQIALHVDEIIGNQEVVMKPIGPQLARVPGMVGATVMGDGNIVLILNAVQLANREFLAAGSLKVSHTQIEEVVEEKPPLILVVDDSLTMRKVLSRLLEREGYTVLLAKDGMDALQTLNEHTPDIILTDIEMPRMDGFEFARNVRSDIKLAGVPIVVISSRTADKHRKLADEIGINAYLGKPVQDDELINQVELLLGKSVSESAV